MWHWTHLTWHWRCLMWHWKSRAGVSWMGRGQRWCASVCENCCLHLPIVPVSQSGSWGSRFFFDRSFFPTWALLAAKTCLQHHNVKIWSIGTGIVNMKSLLWLPNGVNHDMRWMRYVRSSNGQDAICTTWIYQLSSSPHSWQSDNLKWNIFRCVSISRMPKIFWKIKQRPFHLTKKYPFNSSLNHSTGPQTHILWTLEWQNHQWPWNVENIYFESYDQELKLLSFVSFSDTEKLLQSEV